MFDWVPYIRFTGADEHGNQPVPNKTKGHHQRQAASSWTTAPAAAVPAQRTGTQPCTLQLRSLWSNPSPEAHPTACWTVAKERRCPHQPLLQGRSSSDPVLFLISKQRSTEHNSQILRESDGHHCKTLSVCTGYQLCPIQPSHECLQESLSHRLQGTANESGQRTLPIVLQGAMKKAFLFFCSKQWTKRAIFSKAWYPWSAALEEGTDMSATETETCIIDMATEPRSPKSPMLCYDEEAHRKVNMETPWNNTSVFLGKDEQSFSGTTTFAWKLSKRMYGTTYRFQEEETVDGTSSAPFDQGRITRQFPSSKHHSYNKCGVRKCTNSIEWGRLYHKTIAVIFASRLLQIGYDHWPHTDDVAYNVNKMRHTQVISQDDLPQSRARGYPSPCLSAVQLIDYEFGHGKSGQTTKHTGSCKLQTAFEETQIKTWVVN